MQITLKPTAIVDTVTGSVGNQIRARVWEGRTDAGVPVKAWITLVQPQTDDPEMLLAFGRELKEVPAQRELVSFDIRLL